MTTAPASHSPQRILIATALALVVALVVLVTTVLPAEYNLDPTGAGRWLGLTELATAGQEEGSGGPSGALEAVRVGAHTPQTGALVEDTYTVELRPFEGVEYKYRLEQGQGVLYSWTASSPVGFDLHGEPDGAPARYSESYGKGEGDSAAGLLIAPTSGVHGWFWENPGTGRVTVTLKASGFLTSVTEYRDGERVERRFNAGR
ncbi:MAG: hypothetical protein IT185_09675 [Acidobacteria bacterium]|jgi:hypothetical protein|nr:hypothetical protein [Acidobacteriota bacterium]